MLRDMNTTNEINKRPAILTILCVLKIISVPVIMLIIAGLLKRRIDRVGGPLPFTDSLDEVIVRYTLHGVLVALSGIGMWRGKWWGWHAAVFLEVSGIIGTASEIVMGADTLIAFVNKFSVGGFIGSVLANASVLAYLILPDTVRRYCGINMSAKQAALFAAIVQLPASIFLVALLRLIARAIGG